VVHVRNDKLAQSEAEQVIVLLIEVALQLQLKHVLALALDGECKGEVAVSE
jgi:hypothetical protein